MSQVSVGSWGGLLLITAPDKVGLEAAIDGLNFDLDIPGAVRTRDGFNNFTTSAASTRYTLLQGSFLNGAPFTPYLAAARAQSGGAVTVDGIDTDGAATTRTLAVACDFTDMVNFGTGTTSGLYLLTNSAAGDWVQLASPSVSTGSDVAGTFMKGRYGCVQMPDNRFVQGFENGATPNPSKVWFSNAGVPGTFTAADSLLLRPNDGGVITCVRSYRDLVLIHKSSGVFFIFYGNSTDSTGGAVFQNRAVDTGVSCAGPQAACAAKDGFYFLDRKGVYRTTGGEPVLVSGAISPIFLGGASTFWQGSTLNQSQIALASMTYHRDRICLAYPSGSATANDKLLVHDLDTRAWMLWDIPAADLTVWRASGTDELFFSYASGSNHVGRHSSSFTDDDGAAIVSRYRTGLSDFGIQGVEKRPVWVRPWGSGTVTYKSSRDWGSLGDGQSATLGTAPAVEDTRLQNNQRPGHLYSFELSATTGQWTVYRVDHELDGASPEGMRTP